MASYMGCRSRAVVLEEWRSWVWIPMNQDFLRISLHSFNWQVTENIYCISNFLPLVQTKYRPVLSYFSTPLLLNHPPIPLLLFHFFLVVLPNNEKLHDTTTQATGISTCSIVANCTKRWANSTRSVFVFCTNLFLFIQFESSLTFFPRKLNLREIVCKI